MWNWFKRNWRTIASIGCTVVAVGAIPVNPLISAAIGTVCTAVVAAKTPPKDSGVIITKNGK
jgi:hypothetical protein